MAFDPDEFQRLASKGVDMLSASLLAGGQTIAYDGVIGGVDCIVVGYTKSSEYPMAEIVPLAILITPAVFDMLEVDATKVSPDT